MRFSNKRKVSTNKSVWISVPSRSTTSGLRIGLGINDPKQAVIDEADSTSFRFYLETNGDAVPESIRYYLGDSTSAAMTENPNDKALYRVVNGGASDVIATGLTDFNIKYYTTLGNQTTDMDSIRTFEVSLTMEGDIIYNNQYHKLSWRGRITPPGLVTH